MFMKKELIKSNGILFSIMIILVGIASLTGWIRESIYSNNTTELIIRFRFYDLSLLSITISISLISLLFSSRYYTKTKIMTLGITVYILFSYSVTIFTINQNSLFLIYIAIISLCAFYFAKEFILMVNSKQFEIDKQTIRWMALITIFSAVSGFGYWIVDSIIALTLQQSELEKLQVKVPQVLDMAFFLPFTIYGANRMWRGKKDGILISLTMMTFFILIGLSVIIMEIGLSVKTMSELDYGKVISYTVIFILNLIMSVSAYKKLTINKI